MHKALRTGLFLLQFIIAGLALAFVATRLWPNQFGAASLPANGSNGPTVTSVDSYKLAVQTATPAVVNIYSRSIVLEPTYRIFADPNFQRFSGISLGPARQRLAKSDGSGVLVSADGYLLTNYHVVQNADRIFVALSDERMTEARMVGVDASTDLALLKIEGSDLPFLRPADIEQLFVGDVVLAIGNPLSIGQTVTMGIVSALGRRKLGLSAFGEFIQTDAAINEGNSGGALINAQGQLVGINTAVLAGTTKDRPQGISYAIPVDAAFDVMKQLRDKGRVIRGWLGSNYVDALIDPQSGLRGVEVVNLLRDGPAARAGLQPGDLITRFNGNDIYDEQTLRSLEAETKPGTRVNIEGLRAGIAFKSEVELIERPNPESERLAARRANSN